MFDSRFFPFVRQFVKVYPFPGSVNVPILDNGNEYNVFCKMFFLKWTRFYVDLSLGTMPPWLACISVSFLRWELGSESVINSPIVVIDMIMVLIAGWVQGEIVL